MNDFKCFCLILSLCLCTASAKALAFNVEENTDLSALENELGDQHIRFLISEKKTENYLDVSRYTFLDKYRKTFGVVISGNDITSYRLANELHHFDRKTARSIVQDITTESSNDDISVFGVSLGMDFSLAQQQLFQLLPISVVTAENGKGLEFNFESGSRVILRSDRDNEVSYIELFLKGGVKNEI